MRTTHIRAGSVALVLLVGWLAAPPASARPYIWLGDSDGIASDQPRVAVEVFDPNAGGKSLGPGMFNEFLLDSGAQGLVVVGQAVEELEDEGYRTCAKFDEMGLGGLTHPYDVSWVYDLDFAGSDGYRNRLTGVRLLSDANMDYGSFSGIIGVPGLLGRVTSMDNTPIADWNYLQMGVAFSATVPAGAGHRYSAPVELREFPPSGQRDANDPPPTYGPLPFVPAEFHHGSTVEANWAIFDTGAQMSILSTSMAFALGLDANGDGNLEDDAIMILPMGGAAGTVYALLMEIDAIHLTTEQGLDLIWTNCAVLVTDIDPAIPAVLGMDLMTTGWFAAAMGGDPGCVYQFHLDLSGPGSLAGTLYVDINPDLDYVMPAPPALGAMLLGAAWLIRRRRPGRRTRPTGR